MVCATIAGKDELQFATIWHFVMSITVIPAFSKTDGILKETASLSLFMLFTETYFYKMVCST